MSYVTAEIASQPDCWARAAGLGQRYVDILPSPGERVAVLGCGTSWFMAQAYAALRETSGQGETDAFAASEMPAGRPYDRVLAISRSGTTSEVVSALTALQGRVRTAAVTAVAGTPLGVADHLIVLDFADERSVVQTRFATTALTLLRAHLGEDLAHLPDAGRQALAEPLAETLLAAEQFTFLGRTWTVGLAHEAALKMREAAGAWTESYPAMEYRHGPISIAGPGRVTWVFGSAPDGLAEEVAGTGGAFLESAADPLADLVRVQRLAVARGLRAGRDPDRPRHLTRSVILQL